MESQHNTCLRAQATLLSMGVDRLAMGAGARELGRHGGTRGRQTLNPLSHDVDATFDEHAVRVSGPEHEAFRDGGQQPVAGVRPEVSGDVSQR